MLTHHLDHLKNGLTVVRVPMPSVESVTFIALANTGSRYEDPQHFGIAHFLEHMVFKGTKSFPTAQELAEAVDAVGADFNAFTSKEYTGYYVKTSKEHLDLAIKVVSEMLLTPQLRQDDIDREKGVIIEELNMYADMPARHIANLFDQMAFAGSGLEHDIIGLKETVSSIKTADFQAFLNKWYSPDNLVVVVAGNAEVVGSKSLLTDIERAWELDSGAREKGVKQVVGELKNSPVSDKRLHLETKKTEQAHFILGFPGLKRRDPRRQVLSLLSTILGGNMSSRLFSEVREKRGLCYYVGTDVDLFHDGGIFGASAGVDPKRVDEALQVTIDEFAAVVDGRKPITATELQKAKDYSVGKTVLSLEDTENVAQFYGMKQLLLEKIETPEQIIAKVKAVTLAEVQALAEELINMDAIKLALIGPFDDQERFKKVIGNTTK